VFGHGQTFGSFEDFRAHMTHATVAAEPPLVMCHRH
jgi:hypothetical protein